MTDIISLYADSIIALLLLLFIVTSLALYKSKKKERNDILNRVRDLPIPILIIDYRTNTIVKANQLLLDMINRDAYFGTSINTLNIFQNFETYLQIKSMADSTPKTMKIVVNIGDDSLLVRISYNTIKINMKKYLVIALENKTYIANYIKTLGIFTSMIDKSNDGIIITRLTEGEYPKIVYVNNTTEKLTGLSRKTLINTNVTESVFANHMEESAYDELCERLKHMNFAPFTCKYTKPNGETCWLNLSIYPIGKNNIIESLSKIDDTHSVVEITALELCDIDLYITIKQIDITEKIRLEEQYSILNDNLKRAVVKKENINKILVSGFMEMTKQYCDETTRQHVLETISKSLDADSSFVARIFMTDDDSRYIRYLETWPNKEMPLKEEDIKTMLYSSSNYEMYANMIMNKTYKMYRDSLKSDVVKEIFDRTGIKSIMISPIYKGDTPVGVIGVYETEDITRVWDSESEAILKIVAEGIANTIE